LRRVLTLRFENIDIFIVEHIKDLLCLPALPPSGSGVAVGSASPSVDAASVRQFASAVTAASAPVVASGSTVAVPVTGSWFPSARRFDQRTQHRDDSLIDSRRCPD
jgi:hypothetical protein